MNTMTILLALMLTAAPDSVVRRYESVSYPLNHIHVTSAYGTRKDPFTGKGTVHSGLDLRARSDSVFSMLAGQIVKVGEDRRSGKYVTIDHGSVTVSYCHLSKVTVNEGSKVKAGTVVAITGSTGRSTGEHLHITCRYHGVIVDPMLLILFVGKVKSECIGKLMFKTSN